jgi:hypothetical protein
VFAAGFSNESGEEYLPLDAARFMLLLGCLGEAEALYPEPRPVDIAFAHVVGRDIAPSRFGSLEATKRQVDFSWREIAGQRPFDQFEQMARHTKPYAVAAHHERTHAELGRTMRALRDGYPA